jgi:adenylate cyclase
MEACAARVRPVQLMTEQQIRRRLAAILAADVVGYSRMMGADEAGTVAVLRQV